MLASIHIKNFKSFKDTKIESLRKVNLILGGQNVGKTSLLEAVWFGTEKTENLIKLPDVFRNIRKTNDVKYFFDSIFTNKTCIKTPNILTFRDDFYGQRKIQELEDMREEGLDWMIERDKLFKINNHDFRRIFYPDDFVGVISISLSLPPEISVVELFGKIFEKRKKKVLIELLRKIEPRLEDVNTGNLNNEWRIYVDVDGNKNAIPISYMGHGFSRLFYLYCSLLETDSKIALIDEIENGIHYSSLPTMFKGIQEIATNNDIQSLITTHSWECIQAAYNVFAEAGRLEDFQLIRLEQDGDNVRAVLINDEDLDTIMEAGHEIR